VDDPLNVPAENVAGAWESGGPGVPLPVAVHPSYVHARLRAQRACFTIHGKKKESLRSLIPAMILKRYEVRPACRAAIQNELFTLGIAESMAFPDLDGLARELKQHIFDAAT
jgi:hypothetical protein